MTITIVEEAFNLMEDRIKELTEENQRLRSALNEILMCVDNFRDKTVVDKVEAMAKDALNDT